MSVRGAGSFLHRMLDPMPTFVEALCAQVDPDLFFPDDPHTSTRVAKALCGRCADRVACLAWAVEANEPFGVWGGSTPGERARMRRVAA